MKHHRYNPDFKFVEEPVSFDRNTDPELLRYCLGATMYMPGYQDFTGKSYPKQCPVLLQWSSALRTHALKAGCLRQKQIH